MGDPAGIGAEVIVKSLNKKEIYNKAKFVVFGDLKCLEKAIKICKLKLKCNVISEVKQVIKKYPYINVYNLGIYDFKKWEYKKINKLCGEASYKYIIKSIEFAKNNLIDGIVTAPINKKSLKLAGIKEMGHTEIFAKETNTKKYAMLLMSGKLRVVHVTTHIALKDVPKSINSTKILQTISLAIEACKSLDIQSPKIGVCGLNPHASDNGVMGNEEERIILPAITKAKKLFKKAFIYGPESPDSIFTKALTGKYDIIVAMYHDQGHIPLKLLSFQFDDKINNYKCVNGINTTLGLPFPRVSVDHGTAYGKAGENKASADSMIDAICTCIKLLKH